MSLLKRAFAKLSRMNAQRRLNAAARRCAAEFPTAAAGTAEWLIGCELKYGGYVTDVPRNKVSPKDPRTAEELRRGGMTGGDRMLHHGYADHYSRRLLPLAESGAKPTVVEVGVLTGTGLAIWCDLFPESDVLGLDIDLGHVESNMPRLRALGAFRSNEPELHLFDQLQDGSPRVAEILQGRMIDVGIDDGLHSDEAILGTLRALAPHFAPGFVHFIEDNDAVAPAIARAFPNFKIESQGSLTVVSEGG